MSRLQEALNMVKTQNINGHIKRYKVKNNVLLICYFNKYWSVKELEFKIDGFSQDETRPLRLFLLVNGTYHLIHPQFKVNMIHPLYSELKPDFASTPDLFLKTVKTNAS